MFHQLYADCLTRRPIVTSYKQERKSDEVLRTIKMLQKSNEREKDDIIYSHEVFIRDLVAKCRSDITDAEEELRKVIFIRVKLRGNIRGQGDFRWEIESTKSHDFLNKIL